MKIGTAPAFPRGALEIDFAMFGGRATRPVARLFYQLFDQIRQLRALSDDEQLRRAVFAPERAPVEGARYEVGSRIHAHLLDGRLRRFKVCGVLSGGFSNVYVVIDLDEMKPYSLKENRATPGNEADKNAALATETRIMLALGAHPHIAAPYSAFYIKDRLLVLGEYVAGASLDFRLKRHPLDLATGLKYAVHLCRALDYAQSVLPGFVHGDIKPANCLITLDDTLKLTDFGQASAFGLGKYSGDQTVTPERQYISGWGGTRSYMAPEMFDSSVPSREASDMYAFGVTMFEMLIGRRPFSASSKSELIRLHRYEDVPLAKLADRSIPASLINLISRCLAKVPAERPRGFSAVGVELQSIAAKELGVEVELSTGSVPQSNPIEHAMSLAVLGEVDAAIALLDRTPTRVVGTGELAAYKALILNAAGRHEEALEMSERAVDHSRFSFVCLMARARALYFSRHFVESERYVDRALIVQPRNVPALTIKGELLAHRGQEKKAIRALDAAIHLDPEQVDAHIALAGIYLRTGRPAKAIRSAKSGLGAFPQHPQLLRILGEAYLIDRQPLKSIECLRNVLCISPYRSETGRLFAKACEQMHRSLGHAVDTRFFRLLLRAARLSSHRGSGSAVSSRFLSDLVDLGRRSEPSPLLLYYMEGAIIALSDLMDSGQFASTKAMISSLLEKHTVTPLPSYELATVGKLFFEFRDYDKCIESFDSYIGLYGADDLAHYYLGASYERLDKLELSLKHYQASARLNRGHELTRTAVRRLSSLIARQSRSGPREMASLH